MTGKPRISLVVAVAENNVIGRRNDLPWHIPEDLRYFKRLTRGHPVVMGKNTYLSIRKRLGKPLPDRLNIIVSRSMTPEDAGGFENIRVHGDLDVALGEGRAQAAAKSLEDLFVIGGAQIYKTALPFADRIYLTRVALQPEGGDAFFPALLDKEWACVSDDPHAPEGDLPGFSFQIHNRITP